MLDMVHIHQGFCFVLLFFEAESPYGAQAGLKLAAVFLPQPPELPTLQEWGELVWHW